MKMFAHCSMLPCWHYIPSQPPCTVSVSHGTIPYKNNFLMNDAEMMRHKCHEGLGKVHGLRVLMGMFSVCKWLHGVVGVHVGY